jgi:hypothetical protein
MTVWRCLLRWGARVRVRDGVVRAQEVVTRLCPAPLCKVARHRRMAQVGGTVVLGQVRSSVEETASGLAGYSWKQASSLKNLC